MLRLRPTREKGKNGISEFGAHLGGQFLSRGAPHAGDAAELREQRFPSPPPDARHVVKLRPQIAHRPCLAVEGDGEAMGLVAHPLNQQQRGRVARERDGIGVLARIEQLLFLRDADRHEVGEAEFAERVIRRRQLALTAVDDDQIGKRPALLEQRAIAPQHDFVHRCEVVGGRGSWLVARDWGL